MAWSCSHNPITWLVSQTHHLCLRSSNVPDHPALLRVRCREDQKLVNHWIQRPNISLKIIDVALLTRMVQIPWKSSPLRPWFWGALGIIERLTVCLRIYFGSLQNLFRHRSRPISSPLSEEWNSTTRWHYFYHALPPSSLLPPPPISNSLAQMKHVRREKSRKDGAWNSLQRASSGAMFSCSCGCRQRRSLFEWISRTWVAQAAATGSCYRLMPWNMQAFLCLQKLTAVVRNIYHHALVISQGSVSGTPSTWQSKIMISLYPFHIKNKINPKRMNGF